MKKTTIPFMFVLIATAHLVQAAAATFTATIKCSAELNAGNLTITAKEPAGNLPSTTIKRNGTTQVTLVDGQQYKLWGSGTQRGKMSMAVVWNGKGDYYFTANKSTPTITLSSSTVAGNPNIHMTFSQS